VLFNELVHHLLVATDCLYFCANYEKKCEEKHTHTVVRRSTITKNTIASLAFKSDKARFKPLVYYRIYPPPNPNTPPVITCFRLAKKHWNGHIFCVSFSYPYGPATSINESISHLKTQTPPPYGVVGVFEVLTYSCVQRFFIALRLVSELCLYFETAWEKHISPPCSCGTGRYFSGGRASN
jgi:hypothetical protein